MYILWKYDIDWASGVGGDAEHTEGVTSENKIIDELAMSVNILYVWSALC